MSVLISYAQKIVFIPEHKYICQHNIFKVKNWYGSNIEPEKKSHS